MLTTAQAAEMLGVTQRTITNYIHSGKIKARRLPGGSFRLERRAVEKILGPSQVEVRVTGIAAREALEACRKALQDGRR